MPFAFGRMYITFAHDDIVIDEMLAIFAEAAKDLA